MPARIGVEFRRWPESDRTAWAIATTPRGLLDHGDEASRWRPKTLAQARYAYGKWLTYLMNVDATTLDLSAATRATLLRVTEYASSLEQRIAAMSVAAEIQHLSLALRALSPTTDWSWLHQLHYSIQKRARARDKRPRMVDPQCLIDLGTRLMDTADKENRPSGRKRAFRDGLLIALLAARPARRHSLASYELGKSIHDLGDRLVITVAPEDMKSGRASETEVPMWLVPYMRRYLDTYRGLFARSTETSALWLSSKGGKLSADAIYLMVCRRTEAAFGHSVNPHLFRDIAATAILREAPGLMPIARDLLGHSKVETTMDFYTRAESLIAGRKYSEMVARRQAALSEAS